MLIPWKENSNTCKTLIPELSNEKPHIVIEEKTMTTCIEDIHKVKINKAILFVYH